MPDVPDRRTANAAGHLADEPNEADRQPRAMKRIGSRPPIYYVAWAHLGFALLCMAMSVVVVAVVVGLIEVPADVGPTFLLGVIPLLALAAFSVVVVRGVRQIGFFHDDVHLSVGNPVGVRRRKRMRIADVRGTRIVKDWLGRFHVDIHGRDGDDLRVPVAVCTLGNSTERKARQVVAAVEQIAGLDDGAPNTPRRRSAGQARRGGIDHAEQDQ